MPAASTSSKLAFHVFQFYAKDAVEQLEDEHVTAANYKLNEPQRRNDLAEEVAADNLRRAKQILSELRTVGTTRGERELTEVSRHCAERAEYYNAQCNTSRWDNEFAKGLCRKARKILDDALHDYHQEVIRRNDARSRSGLNRQDLCTADGPPEAVAAAAPRRESALPTVAVLCAVLLAGASMSEALRRI